MTEQSWRERLSAAAPRIHCLTNPVTMQDVANILLAAGGSAIMAQETAEAEQITAICQATLLNTGVPDAARLSACRLAGRRANALGHPVVLDPVGAGASDFRREQLAGLLARVKITLIRCNQEEAYALLGLCPGGVPGRSGGVESAVRAEASEQKELARALAVSCGCAVLVSGENDAVSDGERTEILTGGDRRITRITGGGCMLSALCALFCGAGFGAYEAAVLAGSLWKRSARIAGDWTDSEGGGIGSFHRFLFDALDMLCRKEG